MITIKYFTYESDKEQTTTLADIIKRRYEHGRNGQIENLEAKIDFLMNLSTSLIELLYKNQMVDLKFFNDLVNATFDNVDDTKSILMFVK